MDNTQGKRKTNNKKIKVSAEEWLKRVRMESKNTKTKCGQTAEIIEGLDDIKTFTGSFISIHCSEQCSITCNFRYLQFHNAYQMRD